MKPTKEFGKIPFTHRERLYSELNSLKQTNPPADLVAWLEAWLDSESDDDLIGWEILRRWDTPGGPRIEINRYLPRDGIYDYVTYCRDFIRFRRFLYFTYMVPLGEIAGWNTEVVIGSDGATRKAVMQSYKQNAVYDCSNCCGDEEKE